MLYSTLLKMQGMCFTIPYYWSKDPLLYSTLLLVQGLCNSYSYSTLLQGYTVVQYVVTGERSSVVQFTIIGARKLYY